MLGRYLHSEPVDQLTVDLSDVDLSCNTLATSQGPWILFVVTWTINAGERVKCRSQTPSPNATPGSCPSRLAYLTYTRTKA